MKASEIYFKQGNKAKKMYIFLPLNRNVRKSKQTVDKPPHEL